MISQIDLQHPFSSPHTSKRSRYFWFSLRSVKNQIRSF